MPHLVHFHADNGQSGRCIDGDYNIAVFRVADGLHFKVKHVPDTCEITIVLVGDETVELDSTTLQVHHSLPSRLGEKSQPFLVIDSDEPPEPVSRKKLALSDLARRLRDLENWANGNGKISLVRQPYDQKYSIHTAGAHGCRTIVATAFADQRLRTALHVAGWLPGVTFQVDRGRSQNILLDVEGCHATVDAAHAHSVTWLQSMGYRPHTAGF